MKKRLLSFSLVLICVCSFSLSAFARNIENITDKDKAEIAQNPYLWYAKNQMLGVEDGTGVTLVCPNGDYSTLYTGGTLVSCPYDGEALVLASAGGVQAKKYETGGGSGEGSSGVGRRPSGYSQNNTPNVTQAGQMHFYAPVTGWTRAIYSTSNCSFWSSNRITDLEVPSANASGTVFPSNYSSDSYVIAVCAFTAPVSGTYSVLPGTTIAKYRYIRSNTWYTAVYTSKSATGSYAKGDSAWLVALAGVMPSTYPYDAEGYGVDIYVTPLESTIKPTNSITINQNVWNGNIYQAPT